MEDIYVNDVLIALQEMKEETNSNEDDITLGWAITVIEHSIKMNDEIDALKTENKALKERLGKAVELPDIIDFAECIECLKAEAEARLKELKGEKNNGIL